MFCEKCGQQINDDAVFCPFCGNAIESFTESSNHPEKILAVHSNMGSESMIQNVVTSKHVYIGIGFAVLAVLEYISWYFGCVVRYGDMDFSFVNYFYSIDSDLFYWRFDWKRILILFGPIVNVLFAILFFSGKTIIYKVAAVYGIVSSVVIHFNCSYTAIKYWIMPPAVSEESAALQQYFNSIKSTATSYALFLAGLKRAESILIICIAVLFFVLILVLPKARKTWQFILTHIFNVIYPVDFLLSYTMIRTVVSFGLYIPAIISIITILFRIIMYSILIWYVQKHALMQKV